MKWKWIFLLSLFGVLSGVLSVLGVSKIAGWIFLIFFAFLTAYILASVINSKIFLQGFLTGFTGSVLNSIIIILFYSEYSVHNSSAGNLQPGNFDIKKFLITMIPLTAILWGVVLGILTTFFNLFKKKKA